MSESTKRPLEEDEANVETVEPANKRKPLTLTQQNMMKFGIEIPHIYTTEDTKKAPWNDIARKLYREKKNLHDSKQASKSWLEIPLSGPGTNFEGQNLAVEVIVGPGRSKRAREPGSGIPRNFQPGSKWMRWWFEEHEDLPEPPKAAPRSAYFIYTSEKCAELNIFNNKKELKKLGAAWKAMSEEDQAPYAAKFDEKKKEHEKEETKYEDDLAAWRKAKKEKPSRTDDKPACNCIYCLGEQSGGSRIPAIF